MNNANTNELHRKRTLHLFAGAGGGLLADLLLEHQPVCAVEIDPYCQQVLSARQKDGCLPWFPIFDDVQNFDGKPWRGLVDIVAGGFPCQDISCAGKGAGITGEKSGLWREMARIICEVRPRYVLVENSPMLMGRGLTGVLGDLAKMGYDAEWGIIGSGSTGGHSKRERIWIVASATSEGRRRVLHSQKGFGNSAGGRWAAKDDDPCASRRERISKLEEVCGEPCILGSFDEVGNRVDRLKAIGNGQDPILAATAWRILTGTNSNE